MLGGRARNDNVNDLREDTARAFNDELSQYANKFDTHNIEAMNNGNFFTKYGASYP